MIGVSAVDNKNVVANKSLCLSEVFRNLVDLAAAVMVDCSLQGH